MGDDENAAQRYLGGIEARLTGVERRVADMDQQWVHRMDAQDARLDEILFLLRVWRGFVRNSIKAVGLAAAVAAAIYYGIADWQHR